MKIIKKCPAIRTQHNQEGFILIHDIRNKCFRYDIKINGSVNSICFDKNGVNLYAVGDQSEIYIFDLRKYRV